MNIAKNVFFNFALAMRFITAKPYTFEKEPANRDKNHMQLLISGDQYDSIDFSLLDNCFDGIEVLTICSTSLKKVPNGLGRFKKLKSFSFLKNKDVEEYYGILEMENI